MTKASPAKTKAAGSTISKTKVMASTKSLLRASTSFLAVALVLAGYLHQVAVGMHFYPSLLSSSDRSLPTQRMQPIVF